MRRREFITLLSCAAATWPMAARAELSERPIIGFLHQGAPEAYAKLMEWFRRGLSETGHIEGKNVSIEYRWAEGDNHRLRNCAAELVGREVALIVATAGSAAQAAKAATSSTPIVFGVGYDPVAAGLVSSLNRPASNATGINFFANQLTAKRLGILRDVVPNAKRVAMLTNLGASASGGPGVNAEAARKEAEGAGALVGISVDFVYASESSEINAAFEIISQQRHDALLVSASPLFTSRRVQIATLAARLGVVTIYPLREFAEVGGLMSYGTSFNDAYRQMGIYAGRILKGEKPADLPVLQSTKFEFVINLQTAKALRLEMPAGVLAQADEVIE